MNLEEVKNEIKSIVISMPGSMALEQLEKDFRMLVGCDIPHKQFGYRFLDKFIESIPDCVQIRGTGKYAIVSPIVSEKNQHIRKMVQLSKSNGNKSGPRRTFNIGSRNNNYNNYNNEVYDNNQRRRRNNNCYSYFEADARSSSESTMTPASPIKENRQKLAAPPSLSVNATQEDDIENEMIDAFKKLSSSEALPNLDHFVPLLEFEMPEKIVQFGNKIEKATYPPEMKRGQVHPIYVSEVHNPNRIWLHLGKIGLQLDELMSDMEMFYTHLEHKQWVIDPLTVKKGVICAAKYEGAWHRGEIVRDAQNEEAKVFFIDYGTVAEIKLKRIKYLTTNFASYPAHAYRASLAFIRPVQPRWTRDATRDLLDMVSNKIMYAQIVDIDREQNLMHMVLVDTNGDEDVILNKKMASRAHCTFDDKAFKTGTARDFINRTRTFPEKYPSFNELETGTYPSFAFIGQLLSQNINFEDQYLNGAVAYNIFNKMGDNPFGNEEKVTRQQATEMIKKLIPDICYPNEDH